MSREIGDLESLLRINFGDDLTLVNYSVDNVVPSGENFRSCVLRLSAQVQRTKDSPGEDLEFVVKTAPTTAVLEITKGVDWIRLFRKEIFMYTSVIPFYRRVELDNDFPEDDSIEECFPKFFGSCGSLSGDAVILLENLKLRNYYVVDKRIGMDLAHASKALKALARFHAVGVAAKLNYPILFDSIRSTYRKPDYDYRAVDAACAGFIEIIRNDPRLDRYTSRVERIASWRKGDWKSELVTHDLWSSVVHFDFWTNNVLFHKDDEGSIDDAKFIDFQTYCFADIFLDLVYFIFTSLDDHVKSNDLDRVLDLYYVNFILTLERLSVDVGEYSRRKFDDGLKQVAEYEFFHCALVLNIVTADVDSASPMSFEAGINDLYSRKIAQLLQTYEARNWFTT
ncbi:uncharacterized protein LOC103317251 [Nasonia vitripennis]|uniref:CHK kinase-like domain-containing protein n=1 Tax=Nasonia vitripennis TaxID=7425 RepID=A0A7M7HDY8_NASVI|nr:uncharacterized protein LOC103317251 [Nasonia vitripennis]